MAGAWSSGLCDCCSGPDATFSDCCLSACLPCVLYGRNDDAVKGLGKTSGCNGPCALWFVASYFGAQACVAASTRTKLRHQHALPEEPCGDCLVHCCCGPCALCQEAREIKHRGAPKLPPSAQVMTAAPNVPEMHT